MTAPMPVNRKRAVAFGVALLAALGGCGGGSLGVTGTGGTGGVGGVMIGSGGGGSIDAGAMVLAEGEANGPWDIAVDGTHVYWVHETRPLPGGQPVNNALQTMPRGGGIARTLLSLETTMMRSIVVDGSILTWAGEIAIMRMPTAGGTATTLPVPGRPALVAVDQTHIYFTLHQGLVMAIAKP
jgi:hypothetical protein